MGSAASTGKMNVGGKKFAQNYMLARELGSGAFSVVKLAMHLETGQKTAVKIVSKKKLSDEDYQALMMEIQILSELEHPHIIKLYETYDEGTDFYIVTELVAGGELFDRIVAKAHYTEKEARDLIKTMLETMAYMHKMGIVHRDMKPENLLLCSETDDTDIKIADFGFAKRIKELSPKETACGTPGYVAPEILRGDRYGAEVDVWSMGVICYVLLAGYPPFYDEDQKRLFKKIKEGRYHFHEDYWSNTSPEAIHMIQQMLCVDQTKRWTSEQLLSHPWMKMGDEVLEQKDLGNSIVVLKKFNARRRLRAAADAIILANRMQKLFGKANSNSQQGLAGVVGAVKEAEAGANKISVKKALSMIDPELLKNGGTDDSEKNRQESSSELYGDSPSMNPVIDLLNDKDLENA